MGMHLQLSNPNLVHYEAAAAPQQFLNEAAVISSSQLFSSSSLPVCKWTLAQPFLSLPTAEKGIFTCQYTGQRMIFTRKTSQAQQKQIYMHNSVSLVKKRKPSNLCIIFQWKNSYRTSELLLLSLLPSVQPKVLVIGMFMCLCVCIKVDTKHIKLQFSCKILLWFFSLLIWKNRAISVEQLFL